MFRCLGARAFRAIKPLQNGVQLRNVANLYEPPYLALLQPKYPVYECLDIQIKGYDYTLLESYQKFLHILCGQMDLDVSNGWATPAKNYHITRLLPHSTIVDAEYDLTLYERNIQIEEIPAPVISTFLRLAQAGLPQSVSIELLQHEPEFDEVRYVPDKELEDAKELLEEMGGARRPKRKKR